jgi:hypothetical protein
MKKTIVLLVLIAVLAVTGCTEEQNYSDAEDASGDSLSESPNLTQEQAWAQAMTEAKLGPVLEIVSVRGEYNTLEIKVRNIGDETAKDVYAGTLSVYASNSISYNYMQLDDYRRIMYKAVENGVNGQYYSYETDYKYKDTSNLTVSYRFDAIDYIGDIEPGKFETGSVAYHRDSARDDLLKISWMEGQEDNFAIY